MGQPVLIWDVEIDCVWEDVEIDLALFECPELDVSNWFPDPEPPPPKPPYKLHWRRRLAMLKAIGDEVQPEPHRTPQRCPRVTTRRGGD